MAKVEETQGASARDERHLLLLGVVLGAIMMFVGTGGIALPQVISALRGITDYPNTLLTNALILNIGLIFYGWARYNRLAKRLAETEREAMEARKFANFDPLTGCYNRRSLGEALEQWMDADNSNQSIAAIMIDLDNFKQINDANGHRVGDRVLAKTADRIHMLIGDNAMLGRLGGDEFVCIAPFPPGQLSRIEQLAARIVAALARPIELEGQRIDITVSGGIVTNEENFDPEDAEPLSEQLLHRADIAMYHAKKKGKNRYFWFEKSMESELTFRCTLERGIREGLERGEFVPFYEQQVDLATGKLVGFEMLARWNSPEMGLVRPDIFIPVAEEMGLIGALSENLMEQALEDARDWDNSLTLSVNISPIQLRDPWFVQKILKMLILHNFPASRLEIEITESCLHDDMGNVHSMITSLRNQGVKVSLDDFGTGYSSLSQLRTLPFDRIKIDQSFISRLETDVSGETIVDAILSLSEGLNLPVTVEGVETRGVLEALKDKGGLKGQGYHYGLPEDAEATKARLERLGLLADVETEDSDIAPADQATSQGGDDAAENARSSATG